MIFRTVVIGGVTIDPAPSSPTGGDLVVITADAAGLDRDELVELRELIDEALR